MLGFPSVRKLHASVNKASDVIMTFLEKVDYWNFLANGIVIGPVYFCVLLGLVHSIW
jgi:hypothetical protein